ncbi:unnamed protein product [Moneuplotes crassus]|uniref:Uncharacterized protein n=1 Tax=Euplotes crassus TaxID=5936 RepID=A0AAD2CZU7_EUPCR|nr:unnamed protein product [Moneuplotes crassus]
MYNTPELNKCKKKEKRSEQYQKNLKNTVHACIITKRHQICVYLRVGRIIK